MQRVHDNEAGIVPVSRVLAAGVSQTSNEQRRIHDGNASLGGGLLLGRSGRLGTGSRRGTSSRSGTGGRGSTLGRGSFRGRGGGGSRGGSGSGALFFQHAGRRHDRADGEIAATNDRLHAFRQ